jgi:hypothetical protein
LDFEIIDTASILDGAPQLKLNVAQWLAEFDITNPDIDLAIKELFAKHKIALLDLKVMTEGQAKASELVIKYKNAKFSCPNCGSYHGAVKLILDV